MQREQQNIYKTARLSAGLTQEQAAEVLDLSVESVKAYETGLRVPPDTTVRLMAERYRQPWLKLEHARETDELGVIPQEAAPQTFPLATIQLCAHMEEWSEQRRAQQLLRIAADGVIDENERPLLDEIICELEAISAAWLSLKCCEGAKKERPTAATVKRSCSQRISENHCTTIIPEIPRNASKICAGKAVNAL